MRRITIIAAALATVTMARYLQYSTTGYAPWYVGPDSVSQAHFADSARKADSSRAAWKADSAHIASNSLRLGGIDAAAYLIGDIPYYNTGRWLALSNAGETDAAFVTRIIGNNSDRFAISNAGFLYWYDSNETQISKYDPKSNTFFSTTPITIPGGVSASITGNAATATKLATPRTISMTGDGAWSVSFDGSANATGPLHLARLLASGSAGSASSVPTLAWDTTGRLTAVGSATISIPHNQISDWGTYINQSLLTTSSPTFGTVTASGSISEGGTALSSKYLGVNATASNSFALGGIAASSYLLASAASSTYMPLSGATVAAGNPVTGIIGSSFASDAKAGIYGNWNSTGYWGINGAANSLIKFVVCNNDGAIQSYANVEANNIYASSSLYEGGTSLSSKYLGINASIPSSRISDWGTYINQPLLTTSSPTFTNIKYPDGLSVTTSSVTLTSSSPRVIKVNYAGLCTINLPAPFDGGKFEIVNSGPRLSACINIMQSSSTIFTLGLGPNTTSDNICAQYGRYFTVLSDGNYWFITY